MLLHCPAKVEFVVEDGNGVFHNAINDTIKNLFRDTYIATITSLTNGDVFNQIVSITDPAAIVIPSNTIVKTSPKCFGDCNGKIKVTPIGGTPPYTYTWTNGQNGQTDSLLCGGPTTVTVRDSKGCSKNFIISLIQPTQLLANVTKKKALTSSNP